MAGLLPACYRTAMMRFHNKRERIAEQVTEEARRDLLGSLAARPVVARDRYAERLYETLGFEVQPTPAQMREHIVAMLGENATQLTGIEMLRGEQLDHDSFAEKFPNTNMVLLRDISPDQKFDELLEATADPDFDRRGEHWC